MCRLTVGWETSKTSASCWAVISRGHSKKPLTTAARRIRAIAEEDCGGPVPAVNRPEKIEAVRVGEVLFADDAVDFAAFEVLARAHGGLGRLKRKLRPVAFEGGSDGFESGGVGADVDN